MRTPHLENYEVMFPVELIETYGPTLDEEQQIVVDSY